VRVLTTLQEGGGAAMLVSYAVSVTLNLILLAQILMYGDAPSAAGGKGRRSPGAPTAPRRRAKQA
jgi:hypothetical protein